MFRGEFVIGDKKIPWLADTSKLKEELYRQPT